MVWRAVVCQRCYFQKARLAWSSSVVEGRPSLWRWAVTLQGRPEATLPLCLMVLLEFAPPMCLQALAAQF